MAFYRICDEEKLENSVNDRRFFSSEGVNLVSEVLNVKGVINMFVEYSDTNRDGEWYRKRQPLVKLVSSTNSDLRRAAYVWKEGFYAKFVKVYLNRNIHVTMQDGKNQMLAYHDYLQRQRFRIKLHDDEGKKLRWEYSADDFGIREWTRSVRDLLIAVGVPRILIAQGVDKSDKKQFFELEQAEMKSTIGKVSESEVYLSALDRKVLEGWKRDLKPVSQALAASMVGNWECFGRALLSALKHNFETFKSLTVIPQLVHDSIPKDFNNMKIEFEYMGSKRTVLLRSEYLENENFVIYVPMNWLGTFEQICRSKMMRFNLPWVNFIAQGQILPHLGAIVLSMALIELIWMFKTMGIHLEDVATQYKLLLENFESMLCTMLYDNVKASLTDPETTNVMSGYVYLHEIYMGDHEDHPLVTGYTDSAAASVSMYIRDMYRLVADRDGEDAQNNPMSVYLPQLNGGSPAALQQFM